MGLLCSFAKRLLLNLLAAKVVDLVLALKPEAGASFGAELFLN